MLGCLGVCVLLTPGSVVGTYITVGCQKSIALHTGNIVVLFCHANDTVYEVYGYKNTQTCANKQVCVQGINNNLAIFSFFYCKFSPFAILIAS